MLTMRLTKYETVYGNQYHIEYKHIQTVTFL